jgi:hypothetical protein
LAGGGSCGFSWAQSGDKNGAIIEPNIHKMRRTRFNLPDMPVSVYYGNQKINRTGYV